MEEGERRKKGGGGKREKNPVGKTVPRQKATSEIKNGGEKRPKTYRKTEGKSEDPNQWKGGITVGVAPEGGVKGRRVPLKKRVHTDRVELPWWELKKRGVSSPKFTSEKGGVRTGGGGG